MTMSADKEGDVTICWLGQAGFWIDILGTKVLIDPYLSDSLTKKYSGKLFPHKRMMSAPLTVDTLPEPDIILITHAHTDHMDPDTLAPLSSRFPKVNIYVPIAARDTAIDRIGNEQVVKTVDAGQKLALEDGLNLKVFPSAHEDFDVTQDGHYPYLGYGITKADQRVYHSGDTILFRGLTEMIRNFAPQVALLPINGRDDYRKANGVPGNMTASEAVQLCRSAGVPHLIPHHFGMFEFNTSDPNELLTRYDEGQLPAIAIPEPGITITID